MPKRRASRTTQRRIASARIECLLDAAELELGSNPERSTRYVQIARSISTRCKVRIPSRWRRRICRRCNTLLLPGRTSRTRLRGRNLNLTCLNCGMVHRYPYRDRTT